MKVALASSDGKKVDKHFGKADKFYIYELTAPNATFIEERSTINYCSEETNHDFNTDKFSQVYEVIKDCKMVCTVRIGDTPKTKLEEKGISVLEYEGELDEVFALV